MEKCVYKYVNIGIHKHENIQKYKSACRKIFM